MSKMNLLRYCGDMMKNDICLIKNELISFNLHHIAAAWLCSGESVFMNSTCELLNCLKVNMNEKCTKSCLTLHRVYKLIK